MAKMEFAFQPLLPISLSESTALLFRWPQHWLKRWKCSCSLNNIQSDLDVVKLIVIISNAVWLGKQKGVTRVTTHPQLAHLISLCNPEAECYGALSMVQKRQNPAWAQNPHLYHLSYNPEAPWVLTRTPEVESTNWYISIICKTLYSKGRT